MRAGLGERGANLDAQSPDSVGEFKSAGLQSMTSSLDIEKYRGWRPLPEFANRVSPSLDHVSPLVFQGGRTAFLRVVACWVAIGNWLVAAVKRGLLG